MALIKIENLAKSYGDNLIIHDINLEIEKGDVVTIIGASGNGKSTLLRCLNLLETPTSGVVTFNDKPLIMYNINDLRKKIQMCFQSFNLFNNMNVLKNCTIGPIKLLKMKRKEAEALALKNLERVGLKDFANRHPNSLSGGQKQRVAIARALTMNPDVILFDEPTSALDPLMVSEVLDVIKELKSSGLTMVIVTHEMQFAYDVSTKVVLMHEGTVYDYGTREDVFINSTKEYTQEFLKRINLNL